VYSQKEREYILFYEAKKKYYLIRENMKAAAFDEDDSLNVEKLSIKDKEFVRYVNKQANDSLKFTMQEKCNSVIDSNRVNQKLNQLNEARKNVFYEYFKESNVTNQVTIHNENTIVPFNGFSFYKLSYQGDFPTSVWKAYNKMEELNEEDPRKKYKKDREKNIPPPEINPNTKL